MTQPCNVEDRPAPVPGPGGAAIVVLALLRAYKVFFSHFFAGSCRFHPSCSAYMTEAVEVHGAAIGVWLGLRRLARCHPFGSHGVDPVPSKKFAGALVRKPYRAAPLSRPADSARRLVVRVTKSVRTLQ